MLYLNLGFGHRRSKQTEYIVWGGEIDNKHGVVCWGSATGVAAPVADFVCRLETSAGLVTTEIGYMGHILSRHKLELY